MGHFSLGATLVRGLPWGLPLLVPQFSHAEGETVLQQLLVYLSGARYLAWSFGSRGNVWLRFEVRRGKKAVHI